MSTIAIIADDLTGAADAGVAFAVHGFTSAISFGNSPLPDIDVVIHSTESRDGDARWAVKANQQAMMRLAEQVDPNPPRWVYKKIDSALRGHPCEELFAVMTALGEPTALVAPALPSEGRITVGGRQYVCDTPPEQDSLGCSGHTANLIERFRCLPGQAVQILDLERVRTGSDAVVQFLGQAGEGIVVADAQTDADLYTIASAVKKSPLRVLCGSAGFARQFARVLSLGPAHVLNGTGSQGGSVLVVAGSVHPATAAQVEHLARKGYPVVRPTQSLLDSPSNPVGAVAQTIAAHMSEGRSVILTTAGLQPSSLGPTFVASRLADIVVKSISSIRIGGLVLSGGDVAAKVLSAIGAKVMHLRGEVRPAMPWGMVESEFTYPLPLVTKAGSFGDDDALEASLEFLVHLNDIRR